MAYTRQYLQTPRKGRVASLVHLEGGDAQLKLVLNLEKVGVNSWQLIWLDETFSKNAG